MKRYELARVPAATGVKEDTDKLAALLADGWEPFAVTPSNACFIYHLRRITDDD